MQADPDRRRGGGHLPPGHEPGAQTRRIARGTPWGMGVLVLLAVALLAGGIVLLALASHTKNPSGSRVGAAILIALGLLMTPVVYYIWRRVHPRQTRHFQVRVERVEVRRGDTVDATLVISDADKVSDSLELGLVCTEYYDEKKTVYTQNGATQERVTAKAEPFAKWNHADRGQARQTIRFTVPPDAPFSYEGGTVSWAWHISAIDRREHGFDPHSDVPIWVSP